MTHADPDAEVIAMLARAFDWARTGECGRLSALLAAGCSPNLTNDRGDTLLILATYHQHAETVELLLEHHADVERVNDNGQTALASAVFGNNAPLVDRLIGVGADPATGIRSALAVAQFFGLDAMTARLS